MDQTVGKKVVLALTSSWAKAKHSGLWIKIQPLRYQAISAFAFVENQQNWAPPTVVYLKVVLDGLVLENKIIYFWKVPQACIGMWMNDWIFPSSEHPAASAELGGVNFLDTHFLKVFSKNLFHSHLHRLQLAKCENLTCKWQWSWAMAEVVPLIHWHFWDSETKNVWTFRRRTPGLYTNSSPCSAYAIVIVYSDSQPSSLECQADTRDGETHEHCPFPCS